MPSSSGQRKRSAAQSEATACAKRVNAVLTGQGFQRSVFAKQRRLNEQLVWVAENTTAISLSKVIDDGWTLHVQFAYLNPLADSRKDATLYTSSIGLDLASDSFVRYDYDLRKHMAHLNVSQRPPFHDRLHFRIVGMDACWDDGAVVRHVLTELAKEVATLARGHRRS